MSTQWAVLLAYLLGAVHVTANTVASKRVRDAWWWSPVVLGVVFAAFIGLFTMAGA